MIQTYFAAMAVVASALLLGLLGMAWLAQRRTPGWRAWLL